MSLIAWVSAYLTLNISIVLAVLGLRLVKNILPARELLRLNYVALILACVISSGCVFLPGPTILSPVIRMWSASSLNEFSYRPNDQRDAVFVGTNHSGVPVRTNRVGWAMTFALASLLGFGGAKLLRDLFRLRRLRRRSFAVRKIGRVEVLVSESMTVPFSFWWGQSYVVVPSWMLRRYADFRIAVGHELQHHRQGDTRWIYVFWLIRSLCFFNPLIHLWNRRLSEVQEFSCDEAMVDHGKTSSLEYARCLMKVAQTAIRSEAHPACATGMGFRAERHLIIRRIESMMTNTKINPRRWIPAAVVASLAFLMSLTAYAARGLIQDRRVTIDQAEIMLKHAKSDKGFPIVVNDLVLNELNRFIGTPDGRSYMRDAFARMETYRPMIQAKLDQYNLPSELLAIPIVESAYENLPQPKTGQLGAGLWQFIPKSARRYGMRVDDQVDERLNTVIETDAGLRYLDSNNLQFNDWLLAIFAYNVGEGGTHKGIEETGSRDAWQLVRKGYEGDPHYLARVMAAILIMKNPDSVR